MPFPLIAVAATLLPEVVRLVAADGAGKVADAVGSAVRTATGTDDPAQAQKAIAQDPQIAAELRSRLARIAIEQARLRLDAEAAQRTADLADLDKRLTGVENAWAATPRLSAGKDPMRWGVPAVSVVVTLLFVLSVLISTVPSVFKIQPGADQMVDIVLGALIAAFTAVINFWIGSSQGSRDKDATVRALQQTQVELAKAALPNLAQQASAALHGQTQTIRAAVNGLNQAAQRFGGVPVAAGTRAGAWRSPPLRRPAFETAVDLVLDKEGGFSNHPHDKGGMSNFGITFKTYAAFRGIDPATVTEAMMRALTREEAVEIYRSNYWNAARCDALPAGIDLCVFDFGVNAGVRTAVRMLQGMVGVKSDGSIGPVTLAAIGAHPPEAVIRQFAEKRLAYYRSLPDFDAFGRGWAMRVAAIRDASLRMAADARQDAALMA